VTSGGYKRNDDSLTDYDRNEWILVDFRMAGAYRRYGDTNKADGILAHVVQKAAANFYLLPELYDATSAKVGGYTGSIPMVGYGGGTYILTVLDRAGLTAADDCADGQGSTLPKLACSKVSTTPGTDGPGGPGDPNNPAGQDGVPDASEIPFVSACLCKAIPRNAPAPTGLLLVLALPFVALLRRRLSP